MTINLDLEYNLVLFLEYSIEGSIKKYVNKSEGC